MSTTNSNQSIPPFPPFPSVARLVELGSAKDAIARGSRAIRSSESLSLVIGPPGVGKSLVCNAVANEFSETHDVVMLGEIPITDAASYYRAVLHHLGVDFQNIPAGDLYVALVDRITGHAMTQGQLVIVVDEAQSLPAEVLDAIRTTTNIMKDQQPCVSAVVCGGVKLEDTLAMSAMESFTQRVATRCYLHPLNASETRQYISESIRACGSVPEETMTDEAMGAVHHACNGVPRLINQMMTEAIDCAADAQQSLIDEKVIDRAWSTLQQLPSPMVEEQKIVHQSAPVEFAALSDLEEMSTTAAEKYDSESCDSEGQDGPELEREEEAMSESSDSEMTDASVSSEEEAELEVEDISNEAMLAAVAAGGIAVDEVAVDEVAVDEVAADDIASFAGEDHATSEISDTVSEITADSSMVASEKITPDATQLFGEFEMEESLAVQGELQPADARRESDETMQELGEHNNREQVLTEEITTEEITAEEIVPEANPSDVGPLSQELEPSAANAPTNDNHAPATGYDAPTDVAHCGSIDFEASLHDEVLLLNEMATQARFGGVDPENAFANAGNHGVSSHEQPAIWLAEDDIVPEETDHSGHADMRSHDERPMPTTATNAAEHSDMQLINDDSDLLIIEDEMSVVPRPHTASSTESETTMSVDFQAMLSRMRTGT